MATLLPNAFTEYRLTEQEAVQGAILNSYQKLVLQNQLADFARQRLNLKYTPEAHLHWIQQEAELTGKCLFIQQILEASDLAEAALVSPHATPST